MHAHRRYRLGLTLLAVCSLLFASQHVRATEVSDLTSAFTQCEAQGFALLITDIHLDTLADEDLVARLRDAPVEEWASILEEPGHAGLSGYGSDSSHALVRSALEAAAGTGLEYDLVLVPGDYLAHGMRERFVRITGSETGLAGFVVKSELFMMAMLDQAFPGVPIIAALGNNDSICGDYKIEPSGPFLQAVAGEWMRLTRAPEATGHFALGGYLSMPHPVVPDHELIVLNDIFWSVKYSNSCGAAGQDPGDAELVWLEWTLYRLEQQGRTVTLLMHIPPGVNAYSSSGCTNSCGTGAVEFLDDRYADRLIGLLRRHADVLSVGLAGHTHMDNMGLVDDAQGTPIMVTKVTPAVSPMFGNNPAFAVLQYDRRSGEILDQATVVLSNLTAAVEGDEPQWTLEYLLSEAYGASGLCPETMDVLASSIKTDDQVRETFMRYYSAGSSRSTSMSQSTWSAYACAQTELDPTTFVSCCCSGSAPDEHQ